MASTIIHEQVRPWQAYWSSGKQKLAGSASTYTKSRSSNVEMEGRRRRAAATGRTRATIMRMRAAYYGNGGGDASREPYRTLGLQAGASREDIKQAYRRLALQYHPDVCKGDHCAARFMQVTHAYQSLLSQLVHNNNYNGQAPPPPYPADDQFNYSNYEYYSEPMMGVYDSSWTDWEEWMGWEGANGSRDYSSHINHHAL